MSERWDTVTKRLQHLSPKTFLHLVRRNAQFLGACACELEGGHLILDSLMHISENAEEALQNIELQTCYDHTIGKRLARYYIGVSLEPPSHLKADLKKHLPMYSAVIHLTRDTRLPASPLRLPSRKKGRKQQMHFTYVVIEVGWMTCEEIRSRNDIYLLPFLPLTVDGLSNQVVDEMFNELQEYGNIELLDVAAIFAMLAYERYGGDLDWLQRRIHMIDDLSKLKLLQEFRQEGRQEGIEEGIGEGLILGLREGVVNVIKVRFPAMTALAQQQVQQFQQEQALNTLMTQLLTASNELEALRALGLIAS